MLHEFDLNGISKRQTDMTKHLNGMKILAQSKTKQRVLMTPEKDTHLELIMIKEFTKNHNCRVVKQLNTKEIYVQSPKMQRKSLFDVIYIMKNTFNCIFEFQFNENMDIVIAFIWPGENYVLGVFIISGDVAHQVFT